MILDNALRDFTERYDEEAMRSIDALSESIGYKNMGSTIKAFNIKESFDIFKEYLEGYVNYKKRTKDDPEASSQEDIKESVSKFINDHIFKESEIKYCDLPNFVMEYTNGVKSLSESIESLKTELVDAEVDMECAGDMNDFADEFMTKLHESFDPAMDKILWATGYTSNKKIAGKLQTKKHVFL